MAEQLNIDISSGGNGDIWMRLVSFYAVAKILPQVTYKIYVPPFMQNLAEYTFGDRLQFTSDKTECNYLYTSLGLRSMVDGIKQGKKYVVPYHRAVIFDKGSRTFKDRINIFMFNIASALNVVQLPGWEWIEKYQGYLDIIGIKKIRSVGYQEYVKQLGADSDIIYQRLNNPEMPTSPELEFPEDLGQKVVVFPTGTSRQFVPVWWAKQNMPDAYYAFFVKDKDANAFLEAGLKVVFFYKEPGDIIALSHKAAWTVTTDSFPSHLLQFATTNTTVTITEVRKSRIIAPVFRGKVIDAVAPCHPCLHLERNHFPTCMAGHKECINWKSSVYTQGVLSSIS